MTAKLTDNLSRPAKVLLFCHGLALELAEMGLVETDVILPEKGKLAFRELKEENFSPTDDEYKWAAGMMFRREGGEDRESP